MTELDSLRSASLEEPRPVFDVGAYLRVFLKYKWLIIVTTVLVVAVAWWLQSKVADRYSSTVTLAIESADLQSQTLNQLRGTPGTVGSYGYERRSYLEELKTTQIQVLGSHDVAERVVEKLNLETHPEYQVYLTETSRLDKLRHKGHFFIEDSLRAAIHEGQRLVDLPVLSDVDRRALVQAFQSKVEVLNVPGTQLVHIIASSYDPHLAHDIAAAYPDAFVDANLEARMKKSAIETQWLNAKVLTLKEKLDESMDRLQNFKEEEKLVDISGVNTLVSDTIVALNEELADTRKNIAELNVEMQQIDYLGRDNFEQLITVPAISSDALVVAQRSALTAAQRRLEETSKRYGTLHPKRISAQSEVSATEKSLNNAIARAIRRIQKQLETVRQRERALKRELASEKSDFQLTSRKEKTLNALEQEVQVNQDIYNIFYNRSRQTAESLDLQRFIAQVVEKPLFQDWPDAPRRKLILLLALIAGFGLGLALAIVLDRLKNTFETSMDAIHKLPGPFLGVLPKFSTSRRLTSEPQIPYLDVDTRHYAESVRTIRTGVILSEVNEPHKVILVTSATPGEGKSTVSINLAVALGQIGKRVLLIDADLRRPSIAKVLKIDPGMPGLSNLVASLSKVDECVAHVEGVYVMSAGAIPPNPSELLSSARFHSLIESLKNEYDSIIIDSAPVQAVSDALLIARHASLVVQVVLADVTGVKAARLTQQRLAAVADQMPCVVLNAVDVKRLSIQKDDLGGYYDYYDYGENS